MYRTSEEQVFSQIERMRARAQRLMQGEAVGAHDEGEPFSEALSLAAHVELRLPELMTTFALQPIAMEAVVCLLAAEYEPFMRALMRAVQREVGRPWLEIGTIAELLELPTERTPELVRQFAKDGPLRRWAIALCDDSAGGEFPSVVSRVRLQPRVARFLVGDDALPEPIELMPLEVQLTDSLVPVAQQKAALNRIARAHAKNETIFFELHGAPGVGKLHFARALCDSIGVKLLRLDLRKVDHARADEALAELRREAKLSSAAVCLQHWDAINPTPSAHSEEGQSQLASAPRRLPPMLVQFLRDIDGLVFITAEEREPLFETLGPPVFQVAVPFPTPSQRGKLLEAAVKSTGRKSEHGFDYEALARRFALDPARIDMAAKAAAEIASGRDGDGDSLTPAELSEACRRQLRHDLKSLALRITNSHKWEDLVIPVEVYESLQEMISYVRHAPKVYEQWGFGARHSLAQGVSALFAGPPGTGKTMCASVMARELDMELFRVDLSRVVSKWIGETEKNLAKVFDEAQRSNAIILFDEADSLFAKRTEVKSSVDRYANLEVNFLLQRMESFGGVTLLTTNFEDTIDTAFKRRLTFRMRFEKPDAQARAALWKKVFPPDCVIANDLDADRLGELYELSGGSIRNAAVRAAFLAAAKDEPVNQHSCMVAAEREAREMGVLTRSIVDAETRAAAGEDFAEDAATEEKAPHFITTATENPKGKPRLVPITRPRRQ